MLGRFTFSGDNDKRGLLFLKRWKWDTWNCSGYKVYSNCPKSKKSSLWSEGNGYKWWQTPNTNVSKGFMAEGVPHSKPFVEGNKWKHRKPTGHKWKKTIRSAKRVWHSPWKHVMSFKKKVFFQRIFFCFSEGYLQKKPPFPILLPMVRIHRRSQPSNVWRVVQLKLVGLWKIFNRFCYQKREKGYKKVGKRGKMCCLAKDWAFYLHTYKDKHQTELLLSAKSKRSKGNLRSSKLLLYRWESAAYWRIIKCCVL